MIFWENSFNGKPRSFLVIFRNFVFTHFTSNRGPIKYALLLTQFLEKQLKKITISTYHENTINSRV